MSGLYPPTTILTDCIFNHLKRNTLKLLMVLMVGIFTSPVSFSQEQKKTEETKPEINEGSKKRLLQDKKALTIQDAEPVKTGKSIPLTIHYVVYTDNQGGYWFRIMHGAKEILTQQVSHVSDNPAMNKAEAERRAQVALDVYKQHPGFSLQELTSELKYRLDALSNKTRVQLAPDLAGRDQNALAVCTFTGSLVPGDNTITQRLNRNGVNSTCAAPKACPGTIAGGPFFYDTHNLTNSTASTQCVTVTFTTSAAANIQVAAYLGSFVPANLCTNYIADRGLSTGIPATAQTFSFNLAAGATAVLLVFDVNAGEQAANYTVTVDNCPVPSCFPINITAQPVNRTVCPGANTTFGVTATPSGVVYNWQEDRGSGFVYLTNGGVYSGVNTATLNLTGVTASMNGYKYRVVITCPDGGLPAISNEATLTVLPAPTPPVISPILAAICPGGVQQVNAFTGQIFTAAGPITIPATPNLAAPANPYPSNLVVAGLPVSGVTVQSITFNGFSHTFPSDVDIVLQSPTGTNVVIMSDIGGGNAVVNQNLIFADGGAVPPATLVSGAYRPTNSGATDIWVAPGPGSITQATPLLSSYAGNFNGTWKLFVVDDAGIDNGSISNWSITFSTGAGTAIFSPATGLFLDPGLTMPYVAGTVQGTVYASPAVTTTYSAFNNDGTCNSAATNFTITVNAPPVITTQPSGATTCVEAIKTFTVAATGTALTYRWQVNTGSGFVNLNNGGVYSGVTTPTLTITGVPASFNGYIYRVVVSGACPPPLNSTEITLIVNPLPTVAVGPANQCSPVTLTATGANTYSWSPAAGLSATTGATVTATTTVNTIYTVTGTVTATGCSGKADVLVLGTPSTPNITPPAATICLGSSQLLQVSAVANFSNPANIVINDAAPATPYPSNLIVSGLPTSGITVKSVTLNGFSHTFPDDVDILLQSPTGVNVVLMSDAGGGADAVGAVWTFDDAGAAVMADGVLNPNGTYRCTNYGATDTWIAPGPGSVTQASPSLSLFTGNVNGTWKLFVVDAFGADIGSISGGWSISFNTGASTVNFSPITGLFNDAGLTSPYTGNAVTQVYASPAVTTTYTVTSSNTGPASNNSFNYSGAAISIRDANTAIPYPATIAVTGLPATGVTVKSITLNGLTHTFPGDIDILLRSPSGQNVVLMSDAGGGASLNNVTYTFSQSAATALSAVYNPSGTYLPTNVGVPDTWIAPGPGSVSQASPNLTTFTGDPNGTWNLYIVDDAGADLGTLTGWTITFNVGATTCTSPPRSVTVTVHNPIVFTQHPQNRTACAEDDVTFTVAATGTVQTYQWQVSTNGGSTWTNITGATSATLTLTNVQTSMSGYRYRAVLSSVGCGSSFSNAAILTVNPLPTVTLSVSPAGQTQLQPGMLTTLSVTSVPAAVAYIWYRDGSVFTLATGASYVFDAFTLGTYTVEVIDVNGCRNISNAVTLTALPSSNLFIFPNPNSGQFSVTYFTPQIGWPVTMNIIDMKGRKLIERSEVTSAPYTRFFFDMSKNGAGVYIVEFRDPSGNRLAAGRFVIIR